MAPITEPVDAALDRLSRSVETVDSRAKTAMPKPAGTAVAGQVPTADGRGGSTWADPPAGGGGGSSSPATVTVAAGDDLVAAVNNAPADAIIHVKAGTYRTGQLAPKARQRIIGVEDTVLSGADLVTSWTNNGNGTWTGSVPGLPSSGNNNAGAQCGIDGANTTQCSYPEQVRVGGIGGTMLWRVFGSASAVLPGQCYIDYAAKTVTVGDDPTGKTVEVSVRPYLINSNAPSLTLIGFRYDMWASPAQMAPIAADGDATVIDPTAASNWLIHGVRSTNVSSLGIKLSRSHNTTIQCVRIERAGQLGIGASACKQLTIRECSIVGANAEKRFFADDWEAGGIKVANGTGGTIINNVVRDCEGVGIWSDIYAAGWTEGLRIAFNAVDNCAGDGIRYEISLNGSIVGNLITNCGNRLMRLDPVSPWSTAGIALNSNGGRVEVIGNTIRGCRHGISPQFRTRSDAPAQLGDYYIHDNVVDQSHLSSQSAAMSAIGSDATTGAWAKAHIHASGNTYLVNSANASPFYSTPDVDSVHGNYFVGKADWLALGVDDFVKMQTQAVDRTTAASSTGIPVGATITGNLTGTASNSYNLYDFETTTTRSAAGSSEWRDGNSSDAFTVPTDAVGTYTVDFTVNFGMTVTNGAVDMRVWDASNVELAAPTQGAWTQSTSGSVTSNALHVTGLALKAGYVVRFYHYANGVGTMTPTGTAKFTKTGA